MNARWARNENHFQTQGIHMSTNTILQNNERKSNTYVHDSGSQRENHCQTQGIHRFTEKYSKL